MDRNKALADALMRVGCCEGIVSSHGEDEIAIQGGHYDDYILVYLLGDMIKRGECEFKISPSRFEYVLKLLHIEENKITSN